MAIASGKGGTGKTTVAVNLALAWGQPVRLLDCDVEEPNVHLFLSSGVRAQHPVTVPVPRIAMDLCDGCGVCADVCEFNAIAMAAGSPMVFEELCHGCGGCMRVCPMEAIEEVPRRIGVVEQWTYGSVEAIAGRLDVGVPTAPPLIRAVTDHVAESGVTIIDAPPGTSCPVVTAIRNVDYVLLVAEPTPFGLHDLKLSVDVLRMLGMTFGVVINRADIGDDRTRQFCQESKIPIVMTIPNDRRIAEVYSRGELVVEQLPEYRQQYADLASRIAGGMKYLTIY